MSVKCKIRECGLITVLVKLGEGFAVVVSITFVVVVSVFIDVWVVEVVILTVNSFKSMFHLWRTCLLYLSKP